MNKKTKIVFIFLICILCIRNINAQDIETENVQDVKASNAQDIEITKMETEYFLSADFNRTNPFTSGMAFSGKIEFNDRFALKEGFFLGSSNLVDYNSIKLFSSAAYRILTDLPLEAKLAWVYNGLPDYETHSHAIAPIISWNAKYYGISAGFGCRFTSFFGEPPLLEYMLPLGVYANFINNKKICVGISLANYDDFQMDSFIAFALAAKVSIIINEHLSFFNELEFRQSGVDGLTAAFHGVVWKGGAKLTL
jgi:hypothetical protein